MGREIKRIALDFNWPLGAVWHGALNPHHAHDCPSCRGTGYSPEKQRISDDWYDFADTGRRWCDAITQDEVEALVAGGRLLAWTHTWTPEHGWRRRDDGYVPTPEEVNAANRRGQMSLSRSHDAINRWICVDARCKRLGVAELDCARCGGEGHLWASPEVKRLHDEWTETEPPAGDGWQVWETVSEGSPVTPVFATAESLARYLSECGDSWAQKRAARGSPEQLPMYEQALAFVTAGWAPSMMVTVDMASNAYGVDVGCGGERGDGVDANGDSA